MTLPIPEGPGPANPTPRPRGDGSGGVLTMAVVRGLEAHRMRFHVRPFVYSSPVDQSFSTIGGGSVSVTDDYKYDSDPPTTATDQAVESYIGTTISNLRDVISRFYNNDWTIGAVRLQAAIPDTDYNPVSPDVEHPNPTLLLDVPLPFLSVAHVAGVNSDPSTSPPSMINYNFKTAPIITGGVVTSPIGRMRVCLLDSQNWDHSGGAAYYVGSTGSGPALDDRWLVGYFGCSRDIPVATSVVAHNGRRVAAYAKKTNVMYRRSLRTVERNAMVA